ncbi:lysophospholipid acyltransferase family protein [Kaarinaea lacus]
MIKFFLRMCSLLPLRAAHALGAALARLLIIFPNQPKHICQTNVRLCFPHLSAGEQQQLVKKILVETGKTATEIGALWLWDTQRILNLVKKVSGEEAVEAAKNNNRGIILAAPHHGAWEMCGLYISSHYPLTALYRPPRMAGLETLIRNARQRAGGRYVPTNAQGVKALYQTLRNNEFVGILPDQDPRNEGGVFAPFFGVEANTMSLLPRLARKSQAAVFFIFAERLTKGQGYHIRIIPADDAIASADMREAASALNRGVEQCVAHCPEQYQWVYKRFRSRPQGEPGLY